MTDRDGTNRQTPADGAEPKRLILNRETLGDLEAAADEAGDVKGGMPPRTLGCTQETSVAVCE